MTQIGTPLMEALGGLDISVASSTGGAPFTKPVLEASGFDVSSDMNAVPPSPAPDVASLVVGNNVRLPSPTR